MGLIRCEGCEAVFDSRKQVCFACGRCPGCGLRRLKKNQLATECVECGAPFCTCCGRCHACGTMSEIRIDICECGHPEDPGRLKQTEESFSASRKRAGCLSVIAVIAAGACIMAALTHATVV